MFSLAHTFFYFFILIHRLVKWADTYTILPRLANRWVYDTEFSRSVVIMSVPHLCTTIACIGLILCHYTGNLIQDWRCLEIRCWFKSIVMNFLAFMYQNFSIKNAKGRKWIILSKKVGSHKKPLKEHYHSMLFFVVIRETSMFAVILEP